MSLIEKASYVMFVSQGMSIESKKAKIDFIDEHDDFLFIKIKDKDFLNALPKLHKKIKLGALFYDENSKPILFAPLQLQAEKVKHELVAYSFTTVGRVFENEIDFQHEDVIQNGTYNLPKKWWVKKEAIEF